MNVPLIGVRPDPSLPWEDANFFAVPQIVAGQSKIHLFGTPGLKSFVNTGVYGEVRGAFYCVPLVYVVVGNSLLSVSEMGSVVSLGAIITSSGPVQLASNGLQIMIVDGSYGYIYEISTGTLTNITDTDFLGASTLTYQDGYFIVSVPNTRKFFISELYDGLTWSALDYALKEGWPDNILACVSDHRELWLMGEETTEIWNNTGAAAFPFERMGGGFLQGGIAAPLSKAQIDESLFWLTDQNVFVRTNGYAPTPISNDTISMQLSSYSKVDDAFAFAFKYRGHAFYACTFKSAGRTLLYNCNTGLWNQWRSGTEPGRHRANCFVRAWGKNFVGDYENGMLYELDHATYSDNGEEIIRVHTFPPIESPNGVDPIAHNRFTIHFKAGVGLDAGVQGSDPQVELCWSDDDERTWKGHRMGSIGKIGEYLKVVAFRRLGGAIRRSYRITISDPVASVISGATLE